MYRTLKLAVAFSFAGIAASAANAAPPPSPSATSAPATAGSIQSPAPMKIENWQAPQYLNLPTGVTTSPSMHMTSGVQAKTTFTLAGFVPVTPCRLVDTRGVFSPVYGGPAFSANEVRNYVVAGHCGVPAGTSHIKGVSLQVTTPPTPASGDIEVIATGATLGGTVAMVIQAGQWNSVSITPGVDAAGSIQVQLRTTPGDVVIDINGYYANVNAAQDDVFALNGTHAGGGVLFVTNANAAGAAINATNNSGAGSQVELAFGSNALDVFSGGFRVRNAGVNTDSFAFIHKVNTGALWGAGGTLCAAGAGFNDASVIDHAILNNNPNAIIQVTPIGGFGIGGGLSNYAPTAGPFTAFYQPNCANSTTGHWSIIDTSGTALSSIASFSVFVIIP